MLNGKEQAIPQIVSLDGEPNIHAEFLAAIRNNRPLAQASAQDVRKTMALIFAAMESGREPERLRWCLSEVGGLGRNEEQRSVESMRCSSQAFGSASMWVAFDALATPVPTACGDRLFFNSKKK